MYSLLCRWQLYWVVATRCHCRTRRCQDRVNQTKENNLCFDLKQNIKRTRKYATIVTVEIVTSPDSKIKFFIRYFQAHAHIAFDLCWQYLPSLSDPETCRGRSWWEPRSCKSHRAKNVPTAAPAVVAIAWSAGTKSGKIRMSKTPDLLFFSSHSLFASFIFLSLCPTSTPRALASTSWWLYQ